MNLFNNFNCLTFASFFFFDAISSEFDSFFASIVIGSEPLSSNCSFTMLSRHEYFSFSLLKMARIFTCTVLYFSFKRNLPKSKLIEVLGSGSTETNLVKNDTCVLVSMVFSIAQTCIKCNVVSSKLSTLSNSCPEIKCNTLIKNLVK